MEVMEKRKHLTNYCYERECSSCVFSDGDYCATAGGMFEIAPTEMIEKWHMMAFPEKTSNDGMIKAFSDAAAALKEMDFQESIVEIGDKQRVFVTGAVRDADDGKGRMDLLPWAAILEVSKHCQRGAAHYGEHNIDKGIPTSQLLNSGMRHAAQHMAGWTNEDHLVAAAWNLLWAVEMTLKHPELVDTPWMPEMDVDT